MLWMWQMQEDAGGKRKYNNQEECLKGVRSKLFSASCGPDHQNNIMKVEDYEAAAAALAAEDPAAALAQSNQQTAQVTAGMLAHM
jgi:hypothetical protein